MESSISIHAPLLITPRLLAGASVGDGHISIGYSHLPGDGGRTRYHYAIDSEGREHVGDDLQSGVGGGTLQEGLASLVSFLMHAAEMWPDYYEADASFPEWVCEWAYLHDDDLSMLASDLEAPDLIREGF